MRRAIVQLAVRGTATLLATLMLLAAAPVQPALAAGDSGSIAPAQSQSQHPIALIGDRLFTRGGTRNGTGTGDTDTDTDTDGDTGGTAAGTGTGGTTGDGTTAGTTGTANTTGTGTGGTTGDGTTAGTTGTVNTTGGTAAGTGTGGTTGDGTTAGTTGTVNTTADEDAAETENNVGAGVGTTPANNVGAGVGTTPANNAVAGVVTPPADLGEQAQGGFDDSQAQGQAPQDAATAVLGIQQLPATATDPATAAMLAALGASAIGAGLLVMRRR